MSIKEEILNMNSISNAKVPWEPYKAATNLVKTNKKPIASASATTGTETTAATLNFNSVYTKKEVNNSILINQSLSKENLIRYKIDTDLSLFNAKRPGYQFDDECDFNENKLNQDSRNSSFGSNNDIDNKSFTNGDLKQSGAGFVDARFYTDFHFLKLANELKKKCMESSGQTTDKSTTSNIIANNANNNLTKPVNIVGPLIEKKKDKANASIANTLTSNSDSGSVRIWKSQISNYESRIEYLESQINGMHEQLQIQTQVNAELKKLLVAAIGEDLQYKLERLVNDKQRYEHQLAANSKEIEKMSDEIEQMSIRCDLWRSKFLACKLMNDEASTWKAFLLLLNKQNNIVLKNLLGDNELLNDKLNQALDLLNDLKSTSTNQNDYLMKSKKVMNNLQAANTLLTGLSSLNKQNKVNNLNPIKLDGHLVDRAKPKTLNELIGVELLEQFDWLRMALPSNKHYANNNNNNNGRINVINDDDHNINVIDSFDKLEQLINRIKVNRSTIHSRLFQTTDSYDSNLLINVCNRCTGQIKIV